jgi:hypothetical protein
MKFVPVIVTVAPAKARTGTKPVIDGAPLTIIKSFNTLSTKTLVGLENLIRYVQPPSLAFGANTSRTSETDTILQNTLVFATIAVQFCESGRKFFPNTVTVLFA